MKYILTIYLALFGSVLSFSQNSSSNNTIESRFDNDSTVVSFAVVEKVPIYPGCNKKMSNEKLRQCMSDKISELVSKNFNVDVAYNSNIPFGMIRINIAYIINQDGDIENVMARSAYDVLEAEAIRVIKLLPRLKPGYQDGKPVSVPYALPIMINVEDRGSASDKIFPLYNGCNEDLGYDLLKQCTIERIMDFIKVSIDIEEVGKLFPLENSTQFQANFVIDKKGAIKDIQVKAHKREMAALAIKTLKRLPKLKLPKSSKGTLSDTSFEFLMTLYFD